MQRSDTVVKVGPAEDNYALGHRSEQLHASQVASNLVSDRAPPISMALHSSLLPSEGATSPGHVQQ
jgi:hypothetical protein